LVNQQGVAQAANTPTHFYALDYYSGPMRVFTANGHTNDVVNLEALNTAGTWDLIDEIAGGAGGIDWNVVAPSGAWRITYVTGATAATNLFLVATPTMTGAL
jgi:hypothetical protein